MPARSNSVHLAVTGGPYRLRLFMDKLDKILAKLTDDEKRELRARIKLRRGRKPGPSQAAYHKALRLAAMAVSRVRSNWKDDPSKKNVPRRIWSPAIEAEIDASQILKEQAAARGRETVYDAIYARVFNKPVRIVASRWKQTD